MNKDKIVPREARFVKVLEESGFKLKFYNIHFLGKPNSNGIIENVERFIRNEISSGNVEKFSGYGFVILTNDSMNWVMWNDEYPILLQNKQYEFNEDYSSAKPLDIREKNVGSFCIWEIGVADYERKAWMKFVDGEYSEEEYFTDNVDGAL